MRKKIYIVIKQIIDFILSAIALIILFPFFLIFAIIIKLESKGPIFFKEKTKSTLKYTNLEQ